MSDNLFNGRYGMLVWLSLSFFFFFGGCTNSAQESRREQAEAMVGQWQGKQMALPVHLPGKVMGNDTLATDLFRLPCKILVYVDSAGCTDCRLQLLEWKMLLQELRPLHGKVGVLFVFRTTSLDELADLFMRYGVRYPYFVDQDGMMSRENSFPESMSHQVFLLDERNRVVLVGNPVGHPRMWALYREQMSRMLQIKEGEWPE